MSRFLRGWIRPGLDLVSNVVSTKAMTGIIALLTVSIVASHLGAQKELAGESRTLPLSLVGKALDEDGRPVGGATIFLVATNSSPWKHLGQTVTKANGRYEFSNVPLPVSRYSKSDGSLAGFFQIFGKAPNRAIAWQGMKAWNYYPPGVNSSKNGSFQRHGYSVGDNVELDLTFTRPARIHGRFVNEDGKPISGVQLKLIFCDSAKHYLKVNHKDERSLAAALGEKEWRSFYAIHQAAAVMADEISTTTYQEGNFSFASLPPEVLCSIAATHPDYAPFRFWISTAADPPKLSYDGQPIWKCPAEITLQSARTVEVSVTDANGEPVAGVDVLAQSTNRDGTLSSSRSAEDGSATLRLPPGEFTLEARPPKGVNVVVTSLPLAVAKSPAVQSAALRMDSGCTITLKAVDAATGAGVPGIDFWNEQDGRARGLPGKIRARVQSTTSSGDSPTTDANGALLAVVRPGRHRYGIGFQVLPRNCEAANPDDRTLGRILDLPAGGTVTVVFPLRKTIPPAN